MRLDASHAAKILKIVSVHAGSDTRVSVYGSRLDDRARGGDVDLFIETAAPLPRWEQALMLADLEHELALPVDIFVKCIHDPDSPFEAMARSRAVILNQTTS